MTLRRLPRLAVCAAVLASVVASGNASGRERRAMGAVPVGDRASWFSPDDYPTEALRSDRTGRVVVEVGIDSTGKVVTCNVVESSGTALLDQATCQAAMEHARFDPATDRKGRPIASSYRLPVAWRLPDPGRTPSIELSDPEAAGLNLTYQILLDEQGIAVACRIISQEPAGKVDPCAPVKIGEAGGRRFVLDGKPIAVTTTYTYSARIGRTP